ncbi:unnamed protein product [Adineta ricciae]|uniref:UDENN domain-containing protein n=1 Tax=Adineta ricciae TaxID=249248 RepID=A0A814XAX5_ADIRI|nr:unnamed protein product [Adineta ricciae]
MASSFITKEVESRIRQSPEHLFEVFLEIHEPINKEPPEILVKYPDDFSDPILKTAANFAYPCQIPPDDQSEHFTFVILDSTGTLFRFGYCRRSNRESTCLCLISYYPWFEIFYNILNDLSQIINSKSTTEVETFLSSLYNHKLLSSKEFHNNSGRETIEITSLSSVYTYSRPDLRKLPSTLSNRNFSVLFSCLGPDNMLRLFSHLLFERRILFISSKLFHLTACACGCLHLINPMHWQNIFLPILPESMTWTAQCSAPYIIGIHSSLYSKLNRNELGDVVIVNIDNRTIESQYNDLNLFPKQLVRQMRKDIQQSSQLAGDHLARVFLRTLAFVIGNYASGFVEKNDKLDFDRDVYLKQYHGSDLYNFMSSIVNTQMFEQLSRYRTHVKFTHETEMDEFDIEVRNLEQSKQTRANKKIYKILEKAANPLIEQVQNKAERLQTAINKAGQKVVSEASAVKTNMTSFDINDVIRRKVEESIESNHLALPQSNHSGTLTSSSSRSTTPGLDPSKANSLIDFDTDENLLLPSPIMLDVVQVPSVAEPSRSSPKIDSKIKQLQSELQYKVQIFDGKRIDPREEYGEEQTEIKTLVQQFDPLNESSAVLFRSDINVADRHPSLNEHIPTNCVNNVLRSIQTTYGTNTRMNPRTTHPVQHASHLSLAADFDPLVAPEASLYPSFQSTETHGSNLIDFN